MEQLYITKGKGSFPWGVRTVKELIENDPKDYEGMEIYEVTELTKVIYKIEISILPDTKKDARKSHKEHSYKKLCPECGNEFKGAKGLGLHRSKNHGIRSSKHQ